MGREVSMETPKLKQIASNVTSVDLGPYTFYFSYETCVAAFIPGMGLVVSQNVWSVTTGKHLSIIDGGGKDDKAKRRPHDAFMAILNGIKVGE
jgi:hypothetical protein